MWKLENKIQKTEEQNEYLEYLNAEKEAYYEVNPIRFIPLVEDYQSENNTVTQDEVSQANILFSQCFSFYGGFAQISANAKDQIGESLIL